MKINYLVFLILVIVNVSIASAQSEKQGIAYGFHSPQNLEALSPEVPW